MEIDKCPKCGYVLTPRGTLCIDCTHGL